MKPYCMISNAKTFAFSAENPTGARAGGSKGGDCTKLSPTVAIRAGETVTLVDTDGPGMIQSIWFTGYVGHSFVIRMYWDNCEYPSVEAPISAFFGTAYDENFVDRDGKYAVLNSAQILVAPGRGLNCYWEMPFKKHCRITMENRGEKDQSLYYIITGCHCEVPDEIGYFHASYRQEHPVQKGRSYTIIDGIQGKAFGKCRLEQQNGTLRIHVSAETGNWAGISLTAPGIVWNKLPPETVIRFKINGGLDPFGNRRGGQTVQLKLVINIEALIFLRGKGKIPFGGSEGQNLVVVPPK